MVTAADYQGIDTTWCPGCGNFAILNALKQALAEMDLAPASGSALTQASDRRPSCRCT